jgi:hypothetical protein
MVAVEKEVPGLIKMGIPETLKVVLRMHYSSFLLKSLRLDFS